MSARDAASSLQITATHNMLFVLLRPHSLICRVTSDVAEIPRASWHYLTSASGSTIDAELLFLSQ
jgi:hypothetical protein